MPPLDRTTVLRYVVAGLLSTITFTPARSHPEDMLPMSDLVIHAVQEMMQERGNTPMRSPAAGEPQP